MGNNLWMLNEAELWAILNDLEWPWNTNLVTYVSEFVLTSETKLWTQKYIVPSEKKDLWHHKMPSSESNVSFIRNIFLYTV